MVFLQYVPAGDVSILSFLQMPNKKNYNLWQIKCLKKKLSRITAKNYMVDTYNSESCSKFAFFLEKICYNEAFEYTIHLLTIRLGPSLLWSNDVKCLWLWVMQCNVFKHSTPFEPGKLWNSKIFLPFHILRKHELLVHGYEDASSLLNYPGTPYHNPERKKNR